MRPSLPRFLLVAGAAAAATMALAACGGGDDGGASSTTTATSTGAVTVQRVNGIGSVLVDAAGKALYTPDQEADGKVRCTGACAAIWQPAMAPASGAPKADGGATMLDVIVRPDGKRQLTAGRKPLYTFTEDPPGKVTGNGFSDDFAGRHFTWHAVLAGGGASSGSSGGSSTSSSRDGYGY
jgi:predicted lipoprotein with Yx(FWY)xxD motif